MVIKLIFLSAIILSGLYCRWKYCFLSDIIIFIDREIIFAFYEVEFSFVDIQIFQAVFEECLVSFDYNRQKLGLPSEKEKMIDILLVV